jgi:hypothetical protein
LSRAGKEILIKAVAQAIPAYAMACFDLTKSLCDDIAKMICNYWWSQNEEENRAHWISWEQMMKPKEDGGLGFRDLYSFNMAMLSRQSWRLLQAPDSLCSQVLRAKYFPDGNLLKASPVPGMSYVWRSILKGLEVLKQGLIWRVGDGQNIEIWNDPWVPKCETRKPRTLQGNHIVTRVSELIDPISQTWDENLVRQTFHEVDAEAILTIPICEHEEDHYAWHYDNRGLFSVKSAYKVHVKMIKPAHSSGNSEGTVGSQWKQAIWSKIWRLECPAKVHHFLWRFGHNSLPMKMNIERRHVELDTRCTVCASFFEDGSHLFLRCKEVKKMWRATQLEDIRVMLLSCSSSMHLLESLLNFEEEKKFRSIALLWCWWTERNKSNRGERRLNTDEFRFQIGRFSAEWKEFCQKNTGPKQERDLKWKPPPADWIMINIDGSYDLRSGRGGWGAIGRDHEAKLIFAAAGSVKAAGEALHTEAEALIQAIRVAENMGIGRPIFVSDCMGLVQATNNTSYDMSPLGALFREAKVLLELAFIESSIIYMPRECNKPAHILAGLGASGNYGLTRLWLDEVPETVISAMSGDSAELS